MPSIRTILRQASISFVHLRVYFRKYKKAILFGEIAAAALAGLSWYLRGAFVGNVTYDGLSISYATFVAVGIAASFVQGNLVGNFLLYRKNDRKRLVFSESILVFPLARIIMTFPPATLALFAWSAPILVLGSVDVMKMFTAYILGSIVLLPGLAGIGLMLSALSFYVRGRDFDRLYRLTASVVGLLTPASFGVSAFGAAKSVVLILPTVAGMEGVRRFVFGIPGSIPLEIYAMATGTVLFIGGYWLLKHALHVARKRGWIMLE